MSLWRALRLLLTMRCIESTRLISDGFERDLTRIERWAVRLHQISCRPCRRFRLQLAFLQQAARQRCQRILPLSAAARERISRRILDLEAD
jgi:hypothetical protein